MATLQKTDIRDSLDPSNAAVEILLRPNVIFRVGVHFGARCAPTSLAVLSRIGLLRFRFFNSLVD